MIHSVHIQGVEKRKYVIYRGMHRINFPFMTKLGPSVDRDRVLFLGTWSSGLDDVVGNVWRNLVLNKVSSDTLHTTKLSFGLNGCVVPKN